MDVLAEFERVDAAVAPVLDMADIFEDPHYRERGSITSVDGIPMAGLVAQLSATPGRLRWAGRPRTRMRTRSGAGRSAEGPDHSAIATSIRSCFHSRADTSARRACSSSSSVENVWAG